MPFPRITALGWLASIILIAFSQAVTAGPPIGGCGFDSEKRQFAGTSAQQVTCLLRKVKPEGSGSVIQPIPPWLLTRIETPVALEAVQLKRYVESQQIANADLAAVFIKGDTPNLRYFVIHDTSWPEVPNATDFPAEIDAGDHWTNDLSGWRSLSKKVNMIISRDGRSRLLQDWAVARHQSATKVEVSYNSSRQAFVHVENIQVRMKPPGSWAWRSPQPGFSVRQEERLALAYIAASLRAGRWLIPAYHYNIDQGIPGGHDDPQGVDLASWVSQLELIERKVRDVSL